MTSLPQFDRQVTSGRHRAVAVRHVPNEDLGNFHRPITNAGYDIIYCDAADGLDAGTMETCDLLILLGGPASVNQSPVFPALKDEIAAAEYRLRSDLPTLGICLGAQIIASAAGAQIREMERAELGFGRIQLTDEGRRSCLQSYEAENLAFHWHGENADLPPDAVLLASSAQCPNQAFRIGHSILAVQFHPEFDPVSLEHWLIAGAGQLGEYADEIMEMRALAPQLGEQFRRSAWEVMAVWLRQIEAGSAYRP